MLRIATKRLGMVSPELKTPLPKHRSASRVLAARYERGSILVTSNLPFSEWSQIFQGDRMTAALFGPPDPP